MKVLYINCESGASGDMTLGAFVNLGVPVEHLCGELNKLHLEEYEIISEEKEIRGKNVTDLDVLLNHPEQLETNPYSGNYRNYGDILRLIDSSTLSSGIKEKSKKIFAIKARAEAKVHEVPLMEVKFHEAGAVDSVVDVVGTAICWDYINPDKIIAKHVPTGFGHIKCACGILPVPAPAVQQILDDTSLPHYRSDVEQELLTPTGAAILAGMCDDFGWTKVYGQIKKKGYGMGKRDTGLEPLEMILAEAPELPAV